MATEIREEWRPILGYEGKYEVSNLGVIRSLDRVDAAGHRLRGRNLKPHIINGYKVCVIWNGKKKNISVHRAVAQSFIENHSAAPQVNHIDGNKLNNSASNLEWVSGLENMAHASRTGLIARGTRNKSSSLTEDVVLEIRRLTQEGLMPTEIAATLGLTKSAVVHVREGRTWGWF